MNSFLPRPSPSLILDSLLTDYLLLDGILMSLVISVHFRLLKSFNLTRCLTEHLKTDSFIFLFLALIQISFSELWFWSEDYLLQY